MKTVPLLACSIVYAAAVSANSPLPARLCFGTECRPYSCGESVTPADTDRPFTLSLTPARHVIGIIRAGAGQVPCNAAGQLRLDVRVAGPLPPKVYVRTSSENGQTWSLELDERALEQQTTVLAVPPGVYSVVVEAPWYASHQSTVQINAAPVTVTAALRPLRRIEGVVVDRDARSVIADAKVASDAGEEAFAGRDGHFTLKADPEHWPKHLTVSAAGHGTRVVPVPSARVDTSLDEIALAPGLSVVAEIRQTEPGQVVEVDLVRLRDGRPPGTAVQTIALPKTETLDRTVRFEGVEPGEYVVLAKGIASSHRAGARIDVLEWEMPPVHLQLAPFRLRLGAIGGDGPLRKARVILRQHEAFWEVRIETDSEGEAALELWQPGPLSAVVSSPGNVPFRSRKTIVEAVDAEWRLEMPDIELVGTVIDAETGTPVPNAKLALDMRSFGSQLTVTADGAQDGTFRFAPVVPGQHTLQATAAGYPIAEMSYIFDEEETSHNVTVTLQRQPATLLRVVDPRGKPMTSMDVRVCRGQTVVARVRTGSDGTVPIYIPKGETRDVYIVPRDGSLAVTRVSSETGEIRLPLPDGMSRLVVRAESESHDPIPRITVDVRYNGFLLPDEVMAALMGRGSRVTSGEDGRIVLEQMPSGTYEIWPVVEPRGLRTSARAGRAPVRLVAGPGENVAVMTFAAVEQP